MILEPTVMTLFGTTGDLAKKKLYPALLALHRSGQLDPRTTIVGVGRRDWDQAIYHESILQALKEAQGTVEGDVAAFIKRFVYHRMDITQADAYPHLWQMVEQLEDERDTRGNRLYFLATAPDLFPLVSKQIGILRKRFDHAYRRLMIEKPFGRDLASARAFNRVLQSVFDEHEMYRIDHYLGKEMLQNVLIFRFGNRLFEPAWNRHHIDHIQVSVMETIGVEQRSGYYEQNGALRDMVQSHLLQLVSLLTMNQPASADSDSIRQEKVRIFKHMRLFDRKRAETDLVLGQYAATADMRAYRSEAGVSDHSKTETYAALRLMIDDERWRGVPIYLRTGKRLNQAVAKITVVFRDQVYAGAQTGGQPNTLIIRIQPQEGIDLRFNIKQPGMTADIMQAHMDVCRNCISKQASPEAYEKLLFDAFSGDMNLFTGWDEIEASWRLIDSIQHWRDQLPLYVYPAGTAGPYAADRLLQRDGRAWLDL